MEESEIRKSFDSREDVKPPEEVLRCFLADYKKSLSGSNRLQELKSEKEVLYLEDMRLEPSAFGNMDCDVEVKPENEDMISFASEYERTRSASNHSQDVKLEQGLLPSENLKLSDSGPSSCPSTAVAVSDVGVRFTYSDALKEELAQSIDFLKENQLAGAETQLGEVVNQVTEQGVLQAGDVFGLTTERPTNPSQILSTPALPAAHPPSAGTTVSKSLLTGAVYLTLSANRVRCQREETPKSNPDPNKLDGVEGVALIRAQVDLSPFKRDRCSKAYEMAFQPNFRLKSQLEAHMPVHTLETDLRRRKLVHPTANQYTCDVCGHHRLLRTGETLFRCEKCGNGFTGRILSQRVLSAPYLLRLADIVSKRLQTREIDVNAVSKRPQTSAVNANAVSKRLQAREVVVKLNAVSKRPQASAVDLSGKSTTPALFQREETPKNVPNLNKLIGGEGEALDTAQVGLKPFKCDRCPKAFKLETQLERHMRIHTLEKPFDCDVCGKGYKTKSGCWYHQLSHAGEKLLCCDVCGKKFWSWNDLKRHMLVHQPDRPNKCDVCGKGFKRQAQLAIHKLLHGNDKPFLCDRCGKGFSIKCNLLMHRKLHDRKVL